jgi:hypothetical protein
MDTKKRLIKTDTLAFPVAPPLSTRLRSCATLPKVSDAPARGRKGLSPGELFKGYEGKSIKNGTRRNVPIHPALVSEGLSPMHGPFRPVHRYSRTSIKNSGRELRPKGQPEACALTASDCQGLARSRRMWSYCSPSTRITCRFATEPLGVTAELPLTLSRSDIGYRPIA